MQSATISGSRPVRSSERALDALTFFLADVADGLGPFLVIDLTSRRGWSSAEAGFAMAILLVSSVACQTLVGAWIDQTRYKRLAISIGATLIAGASIGLFYAQSHTLVYGLQAATGMLVTLFPPTIAAISLGMVGRERLAARAGRNEACFHAGNVAAAGLAILSNWLWGPAGIFYGVAAMAVASAVAAQFIRESDIDHQLARGADAESTTVQIAPLSVLLSNVRLWWFAAAVVLFHFANAAMLPLLGQKVGHSNPDSAPTLMAICILVAQITMVPVALLASRAAVYSRRNVFLIGFAILPIRGLCYVLTESPALLIANQILDGVGAGIFGVVAMLMMADLTRGTGRFNLAQGIVATGIGLGAAASNYTTGQIVDHWGYNSGFYFLSVIAVLAVGVFAVAVPETKTASSLADTSKGPVDLVGEPATASAITS